MIQYLEYLKRIFFTTGTKYIGIILSELTLYQKVYLKYGNLKQNNPVYPKDKPKIWNTHCFPIPPANEHYFNLTWDIGYIYESLISDKIIEYMAAEEIKKFCEIDIKASEERSFKEIRKNIKPKYPHTYQEILIAFYQPLEYDMILDGRHRYIEAEAFSLNKKLPVIHLHSDEIISALVDLNSFLNYIIVRNIKVCYDCVFGGKSMRPLLQFSDFGVYI